MIVQLDENDSESNDDGMVFAARGDTCKTEIFVVQCCIVYKYIKAFILNTGFSVFFELVIIRDDYQLRTASIN